jgi:hypothetical protein
MHDYLAAIIVKVKLNGHPQFIRSVVDLYPYCKSVESLLHHTVHHC